MAKILCIDIGGTTIHYLLATPEGEVLEKLPSDKSEIVDGKTTIVDTVMKRIVEWHDHYHLDGVAICTAGVVDPEKGEIAYSGYTIPGYMGTPWKKLIKDAVDLPCELDNDVNSFLLGELWQGALRDVQYGFGLTVGTGIGGALLLAGDIHHGASFAAGEIGYMNVNGDNFQDIASTTYLVKSVREKTGQSLDGKKIFEAAHQGNQIIQQCIQEMVDHLAAGLLNIIYLFSPEVICLGGGIMAQKDYLGSMIEESMLRQAQDQYFLQTKIAFAELGDSAGMLGALYHFLKQQKVMK